MNCTASIPACNVTPAMLANMSQSCAAIETKVTKYTSCDGVKLTLDPINNPVQVAPRIIVMGTDPC
jgi:hypothetical protein